MRPRCGRADGQHHTHGPRPSTWVGAAAAIAACPAASAGALEVPRRFFGLARNIEGGGSVTIVGTGLIDTEAAWIR